MRSTSDLQTQYLKSESVHQTHTEMNVLSIVYIELYIKMAKVVSKFQLLLKCADGQVIMVYTMIS